MGFIVTKKKFVHFGIPNFHQKLDLEANVDVERTVGALEAEVEALEVVLEEEVVEVEESITTTTTTNKPLSFTHTHTHTHNLLH